MDATGDGTTVRYDPINTKVREIRIEFVNQEVVDHSVRTVDYWLVFGNHFEGLVFYTIGIGMILYHCNQAFVLIEGL